MDSFVVGVQVLLAGVFALAGGAELFDLRGSRRAVADFGVPVGAASVLGVVLPLVELATAVALLVPATGRVGAIAALVLLVCFVAGVAKAMRKGLDVDCGASAPCIRRWREAPPSRGMRSRGVGGICRRARPRHIDDWIADRTTGELVAAAAILLALAGAADGGSGSRIATCGALRQREPPAARTSRAWRRSRNPRACRWARPHPASNCGTCREVQTLDSLLAPGLPVVLTFMAAGCGPCGKLRPELARWQTAFGDRLTVAIISSGSTEHIREKWQEVGVEDVLVDSPDKMLLAYRLRATPASVLIAPDGTIASMPARGIHGAEVLFRQALRQALAPSRSQVPVTSSLTDVRPHDTRTSRSSPSRRSA